MKKWTVTDLGAALTAHGLAVSDTREIQHGHQISLANGTKISCFSSGKALVQGAHTDERDLAQVVVDGGRKNAIAEPLAAGAAPAVSVKEPKVFVVYGHDTQARDQLELLLLRMNIKPVILGNMTPDGKTIIEALIASTDVPYAVVLLTPDDEGHRIGAGAEIRPRARQNVVLEMGMFLSKLGRERVAVLHKGNLELPSDINGLIYISFTNSIQEAKNKLAASLQKAGFYIDIEHLQAE
ncbi:putative nucleotide-binding protein [Xanthomonas campestris]|uniref:TIR domain-containing protein n=1 Tax=Xanthomonas euroxanthea TaxID=2259622 RepID=UPI000CEE79B1|nr:TIR domain-containing protein [Xanthomonas euroxanthea]NIJ93292.1 putative nucleotide-binding protein [Xanthomonas euroxanthea]PPT28922.1 hypothetical protein XaCFBP7622_14725 [Xanthomonas arboricola]